MAVAFDTSGSATTSDSTAITTSFTVVGAGSADMLVAVAAWTHNSTARTVSGVTYNGVALTQAAQVTNTNAPNPGASMFYLASPATGANDLVTTIGANTDDIVHGFMSFSGCAATQTGTAASNTGGGGTTASVTVTGVADGIVVGVCGVNLLAAGISCDDTERVEATGAVNNNTTMNGGTTVATGSTSVDWTKTLGWQWAAAGFPLEPAAAAGDPEGGLIGGKLLGGGLLLRGVLIQ